MFIDIPAPHGQLEGMLWEVPRPFALVAVLHPHPQLGGTMHHHVPYRIARGLRDLGATTLRFNFRGVGRSSGQYGEGEGELEDVRAGLDYLAARHPEVPLWVAGFSFGAWVGLRAGLADERVKALLGVGLPLGMLDFAFLAGAAKPLAVIQGEKDEYGGAAALGPALASLAGPHQLTELPGATHQFETHLDPLEAAVKASVAWLKGSAG
jgi:alpha/beta superfamily hydrolase